MRAQETAQCDWYCGLVTNGCVDNPALQIDEDSRSTAVHGSVLAPYRRRLNLTSQVNQVFYS